MFKWKPGKLAWLKGKWKLPSMAGAYVIGREVGDLGEVIRARKPKRLPVVMTRDEVKAVLASLSGDKWLIASLMYGAGLRLMECLRVQDIDFSRIAQGPSASPSEAGKGNSRKGLGRWMGYSPVYTVCINRK